MSTILYIEFPWRLLR